jgi:hypothetical protein
MTVRTFKQLGKGYGLDPLPIVALVNNNIVYQGLVTVVDELPSDTGFIPLASLGDTLFTWEMNVELSDPFELTILVEGDGQLMLTNTLANYTMGPNIITDAESDGVNLSPGTAESFGYIFLEQTPDYALGDPFSNVKINESPCPSIHSPECSGQLSWFLNGGDTFSCTVSLSPGLLLPRILV